MRLFVAIFPSVAVVRALEQIRNACESALPGLTVRWTDPGQIHLTLQFIGEVSDETARGIGVGLSRVCGAVPRFRLRAEGLGCFPDLRRPGILWAGVKGDLALLDQLQRGIVAEMKNAGVFQQPGKPEEKGFHAHLTLARLGGLNFREAARVGRWVGSAPSEHFGEWEAREVRLMRSRLMPGGARHEILGIFPLAAG